MDSAIDLSDESKALDLANIRFQLMYVKRKKLPLRRLKREKLIIREHHPDGLKIQSHFT